MKTLLLIGVLMLTMFQTRAQEKESRISDVWISSGLPLAWPYGFGNLEQFNSLAPNSEILKKTIQNPGSYSYGDDFLSGTTFNASLGIKLLNKAKTGYANNKLLRLGISFNNFNGFYLSGGQSTYTQTIDTLYNSQSVAAATIDSVRSANTSASYNMSHLRADASFIFTTDRNERWSLFAGFGANFGFSVIAETEINYSESTRKVINEIALNQDSNSNGFYFSQNSVITERFKNKTNIGGSVYIPLGINFRCGLTKGLLSHLNIYAEFRPSINWFSIPETGYIAFTRNSGLLGIRYAIF